MIVDFPAPFRPQEAEDLPRCRTERDITHSHQAIVFLPKLASDDHRTAPLSAR
jgi:hypothetical protein